jgi:hypothetical protein
MNIHFKLKDRLKKNGQRRYKYLVLGRRNLNLLKSTQILTSNEKFSEAGIMKMLEFLIHF